MAIYNYITSTGTIVPDAGEILVDVQNEYRNVFGADLVVTPDTPQGLLIVEETLARSAVAENNAMLANQINPNIAGGVFLDAIMALTGMERKEGTPTYVVVALTGVAGTIIPAGAQIQDPGSGQVFASETLVTLAADGTGSATFSAIENGPIAVAASTMWQIVSAVLGWETAANAAAGIPGQLEESNATARNRRREMMALQAVSTAEAIISGLIATPGVRSVAFRENVNNTTTAIDGVSMVAHSIYACVDGGTDAAIAAALTNKKSAGANYSNGAGTPVTVAYIVPFSGQSINVKFDRPVVVNVLVQATVRKDAAIQDPVRVVKDAILAYVNGLLSDEPGIQVGTSVSPFELAGAVNRTAPGIYVQKMEVARSLTPVFQTTELVMDLWELAQITDGNITVVVL